MQLQPDGAGLGSGLGRRTECEAKYNPATESDVLFVELHNRRRGVDFQEELGIPVLLVAFEKQLHSHRAAGEPARIAVKADGVETNLLRHFRGARPRFINLVEDPHEFVTLGPN